MSWKKNIRILLVDDDETLGTSIQEGLDRHGYTALFVRQPDEALSLIKTQPINAAIIDCMLPQINGVELTKKIEDQLGHSVPIILMSGIFRDKTFIRDSIKQTKAIGFFSKPFPLEELLNLLDKTFENYSDQSLNPIYKMICNSHLTSREALNAISQMDRVHAFDLPFIYHFLMKIKVSGQLSIVNEKGDVSTIIFADGMIVGAEIRDEASYFGNLLIEKGFVSSEDIRVCLEQSQSKRPLGEKLVEASLLSPHAIPLALAEQMSIRIGKIINDGAIHIRFTPENVAHRHPHIDQRMLSIFLHDWISSKLSFSWLKSFYRPWLDHHISKGQHFAETHSCWLSPLLVRLPDLNRKVQANPTLQSLLDLGFYSEENLLRGIHLLIVLQMISIDSTSKSENYKNHMSRIRKLNEEISGKNYFEIFEAFGVARNASETEINKAYKEISRFFHPDKLVNAPEDVKTLTQQVYSQLTAAHNVLTNTTERAKYSDELGSKEAQSQMKYEFLVDTGKELLQRGKIREAILQFDEARKLMPATTELKLLTIWSRLKSIRTQEQRNSVLSEIDNDLLQIPPEERHTGLYYFVKGLHKKVMGDLELARRNFELSISENPKMLEAKRELNMINLTVNKQAAAAGGVMRSDLKDMITSLFKKRR